MQISSGCRKWSSLQCVACTPLMSPIPSYSEGRKKKNDWYAVFPKAFHSFTNSELPLNYSIWALMSTLIKWFHSNTEFLINTFPWIYFKKRYSMWSCVHTISVLQQWLQRGTLCQETVHKISIVILCLAIATNLLSISFCFLLRDSMNTSKSDSSKLSIVNINIRT